MNRISARSCPVAASPPEGNDFQTMIRPKRDDHRTALIVLIRDASAIVAGGAPASASAGRRNKPKAIHSRFGSEPSLIT